MVKAWFLQLLVSSEEQFFFLEIFLIFESKIWHGFPHLEFSRRFLISFWPISLGKCSNFHIYGLLNPSFVGKRPI